MSDLLALLKISNLEFVQEAFIGSCPNCRFPLALPALPDKRRRDDLWPFDFVCPTCRQLSTFTKQETKKKKSPNKLQKLRLLILDVNPEQRIRAASALSREYKRLARHLDAGCLWQLGIERGPVHTIVPNDNVERDFGSVVSQALGKYSEIKSMDRCFQYDFSKLPFFVAPR